MRKFDRFGPSSSRFDDYTSDSHERSDRTSTIDVEEPTKGKSFRFWVIISIVYVLFGLVFLKCFNVNQMYQSVLIRQFGEIVSTKETPGVYFTNPIQDTVEIYTGERIYDLPVTGVTTSDKKTMIADAFVTWEVTSAIPFYKNVGSSDAATGRLSSAVYSSLKKVISATPQDDVIAGKDGRLSESILKNVSSLEKYGITIRTFDIKGLDLPGENKTSVYTRMIAERKAIEAQYTASGDKTYNEMKAQTDAEVREIKSNAKAEAALIIADGQKQYYEILRKAYSASPEKEEFYRYWLGLSTLKKSLKNGGTIQITEGDPLYNVLINAAQ